MTNDINAYYSFERSLPKTLALIERDYLYKRLSEFSVKDLMPLYSVYVLEADEKASDLLDNNEKLKESFANLIRNGGDKTEQAFFSLMLTKAAHKDLYQWVEEIWDTAKEHEQELQEQEERTRAAEGDDCLEDYYIKQGLIGFIKIREHV
jgi:hypothetical protein